MLRSFFLPLNFAAVQNEAEKLCFFSNYLFHMGEVALYYDSMLFRQQVFRLCRIDQSSRKKYGKL